MNPAQDILDSIPPPPFNVVNPLTHRVIAQVNGRNIRILNKNRKLLIHSCGINVPPILRERFGKSTVNEDDPLFYEAFITAECWNLIRAGYRIEQIL